ncbi:DUF5610 domain-containing protein [Gilvimarinus chinensis]|uniref:DUF5610 domain-containing protein n=1 Tax=Gilvimarinus chinensis TaxID=396005 RepID=UPI000378462F|nr:DUF5610 domain-containing protein [Gilvimarinus chinensis]
MLTKQTSDTPLIAQKTTQVNVSRHLSLLSERVQSNMDTAEGRSLGVNPLTAEQAAGNILGFIERQLQRDAAAGASESELQSRLQAGLEGFKKGFSEAEEKLSALNMLNDSVRTDIDKTYDLVTAGVSRLADTYAPQLSDSVSLSQAAQQMSAPTSALYDYAGAQSFEFMVRTKEGDTITVAARSSMGASASFKETENGAAYEFAQVSSSRFNLLVSGDLNEQEQKALADLLDQVDHLSKTFFTGDLDEAFAYAQELGYDDNQISGFALKLTRVEYQRVGASYGQEPGQGLAEKLEPVGHFINETQSALSKASVFAEPVELLQSIIDALYHNHPDRPGSQGSRFTDFVHTILAQSVVLSGSEITETD